MTRPGRAPIRDASDATRAVRHVRQISPSENSAQGVGQFARRVLAPALTPPRDVIVGPHQQRALFANLAQAGPGAVGVRIGLGRTDRRLHHLDFERLRRTRRRRLPSCAITRSDEQEGRPAPNQIVRR